MRAFLSQLATIQQAAAVTALIEILQGEDPDLSAAASAALGRIGAAAAAATGSGGDYLGSSIG